jgi:AAA family ATP:ADP antiporter
MSTPSVVHRLSATINAEAHELRPALSGFLLFF